MNDNLSVTRANKTKQKIIDAAVILITEKGFTATTIRDICTTADVSIGAFYHHFENKQALVASGFLMFDKTLNESLQT
ncbi:MAG: TetR/AcrR family transcriptional regulator, partial [Oscillospiraceae bacterium]